MNNHTNSSNNNSNTRFTWHINAHPNGSVEVNTAYTMCGDNIFSNPDRPCESQMAPSPGPKPEAQGHKPKPAPESERSKNQGEKPEEGEDEEGKAEATPKRVAKPRTELDSALSQTMKIREKYLKVCAKARSLLDLVDEGGN